MCKVDYSIKCQKCKLLGHTKDGCEVRMSKFKRGLFVIPRDCKFCGVKGGVDGHYSKECLNQQMI